MLAALFTLVAVHMPAGAASPGAGEIAPGAGAGAVDATGRFTTSVSVEVPHFHGLEPALGLAYDSGTGNGFTGMGWTLRGQSFVERAAPGRGMPRYDANDIFLMDGQELMACTAFGGTHCLRQQSYGRIVRQPNDQWDVWERNGTKSTYAPVVTTRFGTFRWGLTSRTDTHGNTVTYSYWRAAPENATLDAISYNGTTIKLWRESRPDTVTFTNGDYVSDQYAAASELIYILG